MKGLTIFSISIALLYMGYWNEHVGLISKEAPNDFNGFGGGDVVTTVSVEEQNMVENSSSQQGFVRQENGIGFYFVKEHNHNRY
ncbi:hypothetical protein ACFCYN_16770 [Gottfriedia sp. NPDC056225]|uniref:hypothetical protein n=1 Tax=Gottfriedia sp. NPDC056225 TaxID=3345751 RepID=UPI0035D7E4A1